MLKLLSLVSLLLISGAGFAADVAVNAVTIPSVEYVQNIDKATQAKVDTSANADQTLAGKYNVTGEFRVPTPPLPSAN